MALLKKKKKAEAMIETSKKAGGPKMYKSYDIRWLKELGDEHPDSEKLVSEYEKKFGEIK